MKIMAMTMMGIENYKNDTENADGAGDEMVAHG